MSRKLLVLSLFIVSFSFGLVYADGLDSYFKEANELYSKSDFSGALEIYNKIYEQGVESSELFYNMSNTYYRLGELGYATLFIEKAYNLNPRDKDINYNRNFILNLTSQKPDYFQNFMRAFSLNTLLYSALFLYVLFFLFMIISLSYNPRFLYWIKFSVFCLLVLNLIWCFSLYQVFYKYKEGVIVGGEANVYSAPSTDSVISLSVPGGKKFFIMDKRDDWYNIFLKDKRLKGWIKRESGEIV